METKKDIYHLWVEYTTKNEEVYFREFISRFVSIWKNQLELDLPNCPRWDEVQSDSGPHLARLPDELLPAIGKFIIIARDESEQNIISDEKIQETAILIECLVIISRNFDNIPTVIGFEYSSHLIVILTKVFFKIVEYKKTTYIEIELFNNFSKLLEVTYDPCLTWRSFINGQLAEHHQLPYQPEPIHVEIVPFIYDCFQVDEICNYSEIGSGLLHALGAIICGSQKSLSYMSTSSGERISNFALNLKSLGNGMRAISPATASMILKLLSKWEGTKEMRFIALKCFSLMVIVLQRSSPEERQIDLVELIQMYCDAISDLLKTNHFSREPRNTFQIANDNDIDNYPMDQMALSSTLLNIADFFADPKFNLHISDALTKTNLIDVIINIPMQIESWDIEHNNILKNLIYILSKIAKESNLSVDYFKDEKLVYIFRGLKLFGHPDQEVLRVCCSLAFDDKRQNIVISRAIHHLIDWLPEISETCQDYLSNNILKGCLANNVTKQRCCEQKVTKQVCECLKKFDSLSNNCIKNLIKIIEELSKINIRPIECKSILYLLRDQTKFSQSKQLLQAFVSIALQNLNDTNICAQYFDVQETNDGIVVPDIKNWTMTGTYGFIFHILVRLDCLKESNADLHKRRMLLNMKTGNDTGFEIFVQNNGQIVVAAITKREYVTSSVMSKTIFDGRWHFLTVALNPPKRPFSYSQLNIYIDFIQKISSTLKIQALNEPFHICTIGAAYQPSRPSVISNTERNARHGTPETTSYKGMFPSILEKTLSSHVSNYFTLPLRNTTSFDPNIKNFPIGMQDNIFGEQISLKGKIGCVLLAEPSTPLKTIFDAGANFPSIFSQDNDSLELNSKLVLCYSAVAYANNMCLDLIPGGKYIGSVTARHCNFVKIQQTINSIGGIQAILPILHNITKNANSDFVLSANEMEDTVKTPVEELADWEILSSSFYTEWKMIQQPIASFLCLLRYLTHDHETNQEHLLNSFSIPIIGRMLEKCPGHLFDVNALMATHLLIECMQNQSPSANMDLLEVLYTEIIFNFSIWSKMQFQIILGHVQYLNTMIKNDRKYFRKKYGIQFFLDVIRQHFGAPESITSEDAKTIRSTILSIIRYYIQKDINIKEISTIIYFLSSVNHDHLLVELLEMLTFHLKSKTCKDDMILLFHEPQCANLLYNFLIDKSYSSVLQESFIRLIDCLLSSTRVEDKYKKVLRLQDEVSLYPGLLSYLSPFALSPAVVVFLLDQLVAGEVDYSGLLFLVHHLSSYKIQEKLEVAKKLLQTTFLKQNAPQRIAQRVGWQESIARLLIRKPIVYEIADVEKRKSLGIDINDVILEDSNFFGTQTDLITFCESSIDLNSDQNELTNHGVLLTELQASVSEAANVIETEFKELAESVSGAVAGNIASVYSVIRQTTSEIHDTFESFALGTPSDDNWTSPSFQNPSPSTSSGSSTPTAPTNYRVKETAVEPLDNCVDVDNEEQLVYLVTNILFTIFWRGVSNDDPNCWKERGQVLACINLLALNNELMASHLTLRLNILEMAVQAAIADLSENGSNNMANQVNASQILRMIYELVVLGSNEDESKKCSTKLLDGVLSLLDGLMIFQPSVVDDWSEMIRLCFGILLTCANHQNPGIVAMATAKLHVILQSRTSEDPAEIAYLLFSINKIMDTSNNQNSEHSAFVKPLMKALLGKCHHIFNLDVNLPDFPSISAGPIFFTEFEQYCSTKKWKNFIDKMIKPLHDNYQRDVESLLCEPINRFWAECYESCKIASTNRGSFQAENRRIFQQKIFIPWKLRQMEELARINSLTLNKKTRDNLIKKKWNMAKRFLYGVRGPWFNGLNSDEYWTLSKHENISRMKLKLEPQLYPNRHENASSLRDNTANQYESKSIPELDTTMTSAVVRDFLTNDDNVSLEDELKLNIETQPNQDVPLEKVVISQECELITLMTKVKGRIEVNQSFFAFLDLSPLREDGEKCDFRFHISEIREVHLRKYNLRRSALEIFLVDQISYFLNFTTKTRNKIFAKILSLQPPNILYGSGRSPADLLRSSGLTQKWMNREISNFEYLMYLNTIAGRSYNDLSQYPVFPWILADYTSEILDLTNPKTFRDLSKPVGVINPKNEEDTRLKYESFEDPSGAIPKFHYGTHYSNSAGVLHYLLRVEPFTSLHIELQSGRFDVADRQFHSIPQTWKLLMDNPNDVKELIPEFFYFPEFLKNLNKLDLGHLQITKEKVEDVILPKWATTAEEFIAIHRRALESEYVSQNLHNWIDLIFGYKQKGPKAAEALNVFYYCSYEGAVDLDKITNIVEREAVEGMINNFGQIPSQLMREPHPRRLTQEEIIIKLLRSEIKAPEIFQFLDRIVKINCEMSSARDPLIYLSVPRSPPKSFLQLSPDVLVGISKSGILGCNSWISQDKDKGFLLEIDATTTNLKNRRRLSGPFCPSGNLHSQIFAVSIDGKYLYAGGVWDNSLRVYSLHKGKMIASVTRHLDIITCIALDNCGSYGVTGSRDCTCIVWSLPGKQFSSNSSSLAVSQLNTNNTHTPKPLTVLYGHDDAISSVAIYTELDVVISGSIDGTVNVYSIRNGQFMRSLKPLGCTESCVQITFVTFSYQGHIAFSALDDSSHSVHVYNINGSHLGSKYVSGRVTGLTTASDYLIVADDAGDITMSRLNGLKPVFDIPLHVPTQTVIVAAGNTHMLAPLRDGRLAVITVSTPTIKKHSILNI